MFNQGGAIFKASELAENSLLRSLQKEFASVKVVPPHGSSLSSKLVAVWAQDKRKRQVRSRNVVFVNL